MAIDKKFINEFINVTSKAALASSYLVGKKNNSDKINLILLKKIGLPIIDKVYKKNELRIFLKKELIN